MKEYINDDLREQNKTAYDWLWLAQCIAVDYDGYRTEKGLMELVDEMAAYIGEARALLDKQRAEDIKEFSERLKNRLQEFDDTPSCDYVYDVGYDDCLTAVEDVIDDLVAEVAEMVGEME